MDSTTDVSANPPLNAAADIVPVEIAKLTMEERLSRVESELNIQ